MSFRKWSLAQKLVTMCLGIAILIPVVGGFVYYQTQQMEEVNRQISDIKLHKTRKLGELVFKFRDIRIQVRTIPVRGMANEKIDEYISKTKEAVKVFQESKSQYLAEIENETERTIFSSFDGHTEDFLKFVVQLIALSETHDPAKIDEVARMVRDVCPVKAEKVEKAIASLIEQQATEASALVERAHQ